jgi:hypothetical protein
MDFHTSWKSKKEGKKFFLLVTANLHLVCLCAVQLLFHLKEQVHTSYPAHVAEHTLAIQAPDIH